MTVQSFDLCFEIQGVLVVCTPVVCLLAISADWTMRNLGGSYSQGYKYLNMDCWAAFG